MSNKTSHQADWELDFYSRPIIESDGKKRWELLIVSTANISTTNTFKWIKRCPANEVNSIWLASSLIEALEDAKQQGWGRPKSLRCWRSSMKTIIQKASDQVGIEVINSKRAYSLVEWLLDREKNVYPMEEGYITGPLAPSSGTFFVGDPEPLPEPLRGDAWSFSSLTIKEVRESNQWPIEFSGLIPINPLLDESFEIPGLRLFSRDRALALSAWVGGIEPVKMLINNNQLILEAGQEDRWLVTDMSEENAKIVKTKLESSKKNSEGLQFISIQTSPQEQKLQGFWMLKDLPSI